VALQFTPYPGGVAGSPVIIDDIQEATPPQKDMPLIKYTPLDGTQAGNEQGVPGKTQITECTVKVINTALRWAAIASLYRVPGNYQLTLANGTIFSAGSATQGWSYATKFGVGHLTDSAVETIDITFSVPGGWTSLPGLVASTTATLTSGSGSFDLTAAPISGTGKFVSQLAFTAPSTNGANISVVPGANILGVTTGTIVVAPGQSVIVYAVTASAIASGAAYKTIALTGSGSTDQLTLNVLLHS
jgi:hypothetical protein